MRRYLLVLDRDLVAADEQSSPEPVNYLAARQEQEPCEVVVLTLVSTRQVQVPPFAALYIAGKIGRYPAKSLPGKRRRCRDALRTPTAGLRPCAGCGGRPGGWHSLC